MPTKRCRTAPGNSFSSDASFSGHGAVSGTNWLAGSWVILTSTDRVLSTNWIPPPSLEDSLCNNIDLFELISALLLLLVWVALFSGSRVFIKSDNTQAVAFVNRGTTKNSEALLYLKLTLYISYAYDFYFSAVHIAGSNNILPDALSGVLLGGQHLGRFTKLFHLPCNPLPRGFLRRYPNQQTRRMVPEIKACFTRAPHYAHS